MAISRDTKFFLVLFFNISSLILCGWFGIQHVIKGQQLLNDQGGNRTDGTHSDVKKEDHVLSGGSASVAFALMCFVNLMVVVTMKIARDKNRKSDTLVTLSNVTTMCLFLLGSIVVVLLGKISVSVEHSKDGDIVFVSVVIASVLICILLQVSTLELSRHCCTRTKAVRVVVDEAGDEPPGDEDFLVLSSGQRPVGNRVPVAETSFMNGFSSPIPTRQSPSSKFHLKHAVPGIEITSAELDVAKKKLRKSTQSSQGSQLSDFGIYRPPNMLPILVEDLMSDLKLQNTETQNCSAENLNGPKNCKSSEELIDDVFESQGENFEGSCIRPLTTSRRTPKPANRISLPTPCSSIVPRPQSTLSTGSDLIPGLIHVEKLEREKAMALSTFSETSGLPSFNSDYDLGDFKIPSPSLELTP